MSGLRFETRTEPPDPPLHFNSASTGRAMYRGLAGYSATHRYFHDQVHLTYVGYDVLVEQQAQPDTFKMTFLELGIGPIDFAIQANSNLDPTAWKKLATPPLPPPRMVHAADKVELTVWVDPATGQKLIDVLQVQPPPSLLRRAAGPAVTVSPMMSSSLLRRDSPPVPTVEGTAREFRADDAEMRLAQPVITLNGAPVPAYVRTGNAAGTLLWFYLPKHGRYILSLTPRAELGFVKAGEIRGGMIKFKVDGDELAVESFQPVAPGNAPYVLYVLHDKEFEPTSHDQTDRTLVGSVSPAELVALFKK